MPKKSVKAQKKSLKAQKKKAPKKSVKEQKKKSVNMSKKHVQIHGMKFEVVGRCQNGNCVFMKKRTPINPSMLHY